MARREHGQDWRAAEGGEGFLALLKSVWVSQGISGGRGSERGATPSDGLDMAGSGAPGQELNGARIRRMWC